MSTRNIPSENRPPDTDVEWGFRDWGDSVVCAYKKDQMSMWIMYDPDADTVDLSDWQ